jgi:hypothetical protein
MVGLKIETPKGTGDLTEIYKSELGYLMIKVEYSDKTYQTFNLGKIDNNLSIYDFKNLIK